MGGYNLINQNLFDRFSILHSLSGIVLKKMGLGVNATLIGSVLFEILEYQLKSSIPELFPNPTQDSKINMIGDTVAVVAGWYFG